MPIRLTITDYIYLSCTWLKTLYSERRRWHRVSVARGKAGVFYGFDRLPGSGENASGGIVKLQDLQKKFPNQVRNPNILYLISSALPHFALRMAYLAASSGAKLVLNQNGVAYPGWFGNGYEKANRPMAKLLHMADYVFYQSLFCKHSADRFLGARKHNFEILPNPVDSTVYRPTPQGLNFDGSTGPVKILTAGSYQSFYRIEVALEALSLLTTKLPEVRLIIAGRFRSQRSEKAALHQAIQLVKDLKLEEHVDFKNSYTQVQAPSLFAEAHILLHTKFNDPCPRVVVEAMSCGLPVVYSATGGVPELVGREAGIGVPGPEDWDNDHPPNPVGMADAVISILSNYKCFSVAARKRVVEHLDVAHWLQRHETVFTALPQTTAHR